MSANSERALHVLDRADGKVEKWVIGPDGSAQRESVYVIDDVSCSCPGFAFRQTCVHMDIWKGGAPMEIPLDEVGQAIVALKQALQYDGGNTVLIDGLDRKEGAENVVTAIRARTNHPGHRGTRAVWDVVTKDGRDVRCVVVGDVF